MTTEIKNNGGSLIEIKVGGIVVATFDGTGLATGIKAGSVDATALATAVKPVGVGQTWQELSASRSPGVTYTNNTGRTITVTIVTQITVAGNASTLTITESGGSPFVLWGSLTTTGGAFSYLYSTIPAGATYVLGATAAGVAVQRWSEQR